MRISGCMTIRALVEYDPTDLKPASTLVTQVLPQCPPDLPLLEGEQASQGGRGFELTAIALA
jgi:metal transporter CNNM